MNLAKAFAVAAMMSAAVLSSHGAPSWEAGDYDPTTWQPSEGNVLAGLTTGTLTGCYTEKGKALVNKAATLVDGVVPGANVDYSMLAGIGNNAVFTWTFDAADIAELKIFTRWGDGGRDDVGIAKVEFRDEGGAWVNIGAPVKAAVLNNASSGHLYARLFDDNAGLLATAATGVRLTFGTQDNNGTGCCEIEALQPLSADRIEVLSDVSRVGLYEPSLGKFTSVTVGESYTFRVNDTVFTNRQAGAIYELAGWTYVDKDGAETSGAGAEAVVNYGGGACSLTWNWNSTPWQWSIANSLPEPYQEVEYISSTNWTSQNAAPYLNTGYLPKANTRFVFDMLAANTQAERDGFVLGTRLDTHAAACYQLAVKYGGTYRFMFSRMMGEGVGSATGTAFPYNEKVTLETVGNTATWTLASGESGVFTNPSTTPTDCVNPLLIFCLNNSPTSGGVNATAHMKMNLYSFKAYEGDLLKMQLIPCRETTGAMRAGAYDVINEVFLPNGGTDPFVCGLDVVRTTQELSVVGADDNAFGDVVPAYGAVADAVVGESMSFSAPEYVGVGDTLYMCAGWNYQTYNTTSGQWETYDGDSGEGNACSHVYKAGSLQRLQWVWEVAGYAVTIPEFPATMGTVALSEPFFGENYYLIGNSATITLTATGGNFVKWVGDVPAGQTGITTFSLNVDSPKVISPVFEWIYDSATGTLMDGNWTLGVTANGGALTVISVQSVTDSTMLELGKAIQPTGVKITQIGSDVFNADKVAAAKKLETLTLPDTLTYIAWYTFRNCTALKSVTPLLPDSLERIGAQAFYGCSALEGDLRLGGDKGIVFEGTGYNASTFENCSKIGSVTLGEGTDKIFNGVFAACSSLTNAVLPETLTYIGSYAFASCTSLTTVTPFLPASVTYIGAYAFNNCSAIEGALTLGEGLKEIPMWTFSGCAKVTSLHLPDSLEIIGQNSLCQMFALTHVEPFLPPNVKTIAAAAFYDTPVEDPLVLSCPDLTKITGSGNFGAFRFIHSPSVDLSKSAVSEIPLNTFADAPYITSVTMSTNMTTIGAGAFSAGTTQLPLAIYWTGEPPASLDANAFNRSPLRLCHVLPREVAAWDDYLANSCVFEAITADSSDEKAFHEVFPNIRRVSGKAKMPSATANYEYVSRWNPFPAPGTMIMLK